MINIDNLPQCTLKKTSKYKINDKVYYMTHSDLGCVDFDKAKEEYTSQLEFSELPKSVDALFSFCNDVFLIEFKSGRLAKKEIYGIRLKIFDSLLMLTDMLKIDISHTQQKFKFILVYNEEKNPFSEEENEEMRKLGLSPAPARTEIAKNIANKTTNKKFIRFSLSRFEKLYFNEVFTVTKDEFESKYIQAWSKTQ